MMNIPPSEANRLSMHDYESILWNWNDAQKAGDIEAPDPDVAMAMIDKINADPRLTGPRKAAESVN
jgi:hypothetical protein